MTTINPYDLMTEAEVYDKYKGRFADRELREARRSGQIEFYDLRKGVHYSPEQISDYLKSKVKRQCKNEKLDSEPEDKPKASERPSGFSRSGNTGSTDQSRAARSSTIVGMTPDLEKRAAARLE